MIYAQKIQVSTGEVVETRQLEGLADYEALCGSDEPFTYWTSKQVSQCEQCDSLFIVGEERFFGGRCGKSEFCCYECKLDADEEIAYWDQVDRQEIDY